MANNNLLNFVNNASSSIQDAMGKPPKKMRVVNVRKFVQGRVKRLDNGSSRSRVTDGNNSTKSKSAPRKTPCQPTRGSSCSWPDVNRCNTTHLSSSSILSVPSLAEGLISTCGYSTTTMPTLDMRSYSEPNLCLPPSSQPIDPELESLLSSLASPSDPLSRRSSFESVYNNTSCTPPSVGNPEVQVFPCEQPFSPYSDISTDDLDSAYSSPIESVRLSYNCSPTNFTTTTSNNTVSLPIWTSPLSSNTDWLPAATSNCLQEMGGISSPSCDWMSSDSLTTTTSTMSVYDQGPPMTPTVSQLLEQYNQY